MSSAVSSDSRKRSQFNDTTFKGVVLYSERMLRVGVNNMRFTSLYFIIVSVLLNGCVTVKMASDGLGKKAEGVVFTEPKRPFTREDRKEVDAAWKNSANGNVISFISDCADPTDPSLEQIVGGILSGLSDLKVNSQESPTVQGREGHRVYASGKVDGVPSEIDLLAFKRNHCIYILTYVGVQRSFSDDRAAFTKFIEGFRAP